MPPLSDNTLKWLIAAAIALLLIHQVGSVIATLFGQIWGGLSALLVIVVSFFSARLARAGGRSSFWFLLPTLLFTVLPGALMAWSFAGQETGTFDFALALAPFLIGFAMPVVLLLCVYFALRNRSDSY